MPPGGKANRDMFKSLRNAFISGLLLLAPVAVTIWVFNLLVDSIGAPTRELFFPFLTKELAAFRWAGYLLKIISVFIVLIIITLLGWFSKLVIGRMVVQGFDRFFTRVPFVKNVYMTVKQIVDTFSQQKKAVFQKVVLLEFPRKGSYAIGFFTSDAKGEVQSKTAKEIVNIFLPTTPNPTSGYLIMIPKDDIIDLEMSVPEGMKLIISGGAVVPFYNPKTGRKETAEISNPQRAAHAGGH